MNMFRHHDESVQAIATFAAIPTNRLQKTAHVSFDDEQFSAVVCREGHEIGSGRGDKSSRLQEQNLSGWKPHVPSDCKLARVELVPFPVIFLARVFVLGKS